MANLDKSQLKAIQDGQTWEEVSKEQKANFDLVADEVNKKADSSSLSTTYATKSELGNKVDKDGSKVLSEKNFTSAYETKLNGVAENANNYVHPSGSGNKHIPTGGSSGQVLVWSADGTAVWGSVPAAASTMSVKSVKAPSKALGDNPTKAEFDALIDKLIAAGVFTA